MSAWFCVTVTFGPHSPDKDGFVGHTVLQFPSLKVIQSETEAPSSCGPKTSSVAHQVRFIVSGSLFTVILG